MVSHYPGGCLVAQHSRRKVFMGKGTKTQGQDTTKYKVIAIVKISELAKNSKTMQNCNWKELFDILGI